MFNNKCDNPIKQLFRNIPKDTFPAFALLQTQKSQLIKKTESHKNTKERKNI